VLPIARSTWWTSESPATRRYRDVAGEDARGRIFDRRGRALECSRNLRSMLIELEVQIGDDL